MARSRIGLTADRHAVELATRLGRALRDARQRHGVTQREAAARAGLSQSCWSRLERDGDGRFTLATWDRAAHAVGTTLGAYLPQSTAADLPRDATQLKAQELVIALARLGAWHGLPEQQLDAEARTSRFGDVVLQRPRHGPTEVALIEIIDWFADVGAPMRDWPRRLEALERQAIGRMAEGQDVPTVSGCWVIRATRRNRGLIAQHANVFRNRFPGSGRAWLAALRDPQTPMPTDAALLWIAVNSDRLFPMRLGKPDD